MNPFTSAIRLALPLSLLLAAGCAHQEANRLRADFGKANETVLVQQLHDPKTSMEPSLDTPEGMDGQRANGVIRSLRSDNGSRDFGDAGVSTNSVIQTGN